MRTDRRRHALLTPEKRIPKHVSGLMNRTRNQNADIFSKIDTIRRCPRSGQSARPLTCIICLQNSIVLFSTPQARPFSTLVVLMLIRQEVACCPSVSPTPHKRLGKAVETSKLLIEASAEKLPTSKHQLIMFPNKPHALEGTVISARMFQSCCH